ncbi:class I SAM-dependent methyltransferase [Frankia sp. Ag45/Mut15]|uniref:Class I SAM-dependent methyltransferase n=1 Tax=Frankia umida TaxID=573489 RepID=A0ABT0JY39_9ACTN|nr:class I SAM-dependent methyltransferase [Frankia umida]MCK9876355.1 class I SAM-dependent methyltransferase [Frankia umida]
MPSQRRGWLPVAIGIGIGVNTARLHARVQALDTIETLETAASDHVHGIDADPSPYLLLTGADVRLTDAQRLAAQAYATRRGLDVLDLVPATLSPHQLLDLARMVDPASFPSRRIARGRSAGAAVLVRRDVLVRSGLLAAADPTHTTDPTDTSDPAHATGMTPADRTVQAVGTADIGGLTAAELVALLQLGKRHAPITTDLAVLPGLSVADDRGAHRWTVQRTAYAWEPAQLVLPALRDAAILLTAGGCPPAALAALTASWLQPALVGGRRVRVTGADLARSPLRRRRDGLGQLRAAATRVWPGHAGETPTRPPASPASARAGQTGQAGPAGPGEQGRGLRRELLEVSVRPDPAQVARSRVAYQADLAAGLDRFLEPAQAYCPWCGAGDLVAHLRGRDVTQGKPGTFRYDRCTACGHIFQNPRLSLDGLDFYYRDFYDGLGASALEELFGFDDRVYLERARQAIPTPRRWLDVGGGHGHFCNSARSIWPSTRFDLLDMGGGVEQARRRGWADEVYRGQFPELADGLKGQYDILSMFHYLEHTREPQAELDAAARVLSPGAHLLIEVPNPHSPAARWYGSMWPGWLIPQHQHLIPAANLVAALEERGFETSGPIFGEVHQPGDPLSVPFGFLQTRAPSPSNPWGSAEASTALRLRRAALATALAPAFAAGLVLDGVTRPYLTGGSRSNAYRVLARRR